MTTARRKSRPDKSGRYKMPDDLRDSFRLNPEMVRF
jgi:hypothetical protein